MSQETKKYPQPYLTKPGLYIDSMSKEEFLRIDSLHVDDKGYKIVDYTVVWSGCPSTLQFRSVKNSSFIQAFIKEWVKKCDSCYLSFDVTLSKIKRDSVDQSFIAPHVLIVKIN